MASRREQSNALSAGRAAERDACLLPDAPNLDWLAGVIHDLDNELTVLKGQIDLLQRRIGHAHSAQQGQVQSSLTAIDAATRRLIRITGELRDLHAARQGWMLRLERQRRDLGALVLQIIGEQQQVTELHDLHFVAPEEAIIGWWDAARLERVVQNLLGNALKYSPDGGDITLQLTREIDQDETWAVLTVSDQGLGIAPADLPHIFEPRFQGTSMVGRQEGVGMGLTIVQKIVQAHGGTVAVESGPGRGSRFVVHLPLAEPG